MQLALRVVGGRPQQPTATLSPAGPLLHMVLLSHCDALLMRVRRSARGRPRAVAAERRLAGPAPPPPPAPPPGGGGGGGGAARAAQRLISASVCPSVARVQPAAPPLLIATSATRSDDGQRGVGCTHGHHPPVHMHRPSVRVRN
jgi:hypothetical protein